MAHPTAILKIEALGLEGVLQAIADGCTLSALARREGVSVGTVRTWIAADPARSARVAAARREHASHWDDRAEEVLEGIPDDAEPGAIARARELASHYRWRARVIDPAGHGDHQRHEHSGPAGGPIQVITGVPAAKPDQTTG